MSTAVSGWSLGHVLWAALAGREDGRRVRRQEAAGPFDRLLEPGEVLLAQAGAPSVAWNETDVFAYVPGGSVRQTDVFAYPRRADTPQTDVFAYDLERATRQPDILGYAHRVDGPQTDAFAYTHSAPSPQTDAFMAPGQFRPPVHLLLLTDRRLIDVARDGRFEIPWESLVDVEVEDGCVVFHGCNGDVCSPPVDNPERLAAVVEYEWHLTRYTDVGEQC